mgnify:FL=1
MRNLKGSNRYNNLDNILLLDHNNHIHHLLAVYHKIRNRRLEICSQRVNTFDKLNNLCPSYMNKKDTKNHIEILLNSFLINLHKENTNSIFLLFNTAAAYIHGYGYNNSNDNTTTDWSSSVMF